MTSYFKIFLASREPLMKYKDSQLWKLGESQGNEKGTPMTQATEEKGMAFFFAAIGTFSRSLNNWSLAGLLML